MSEYDRRGDGRVESLTFQDVMHTYRRAAFDTPSRTEQDKRVYAALKEDWGNQLFFCDNRFGEDIPYFDDVLTQVAAIRPKLDSKGRLEIVTDVDFYLPTKLKTTISILRNGKPGEPVIGVIPGFGNIPHMLAAPYQLGTKDVKGCTIVGIEVFHGLHPVDQAKVAAKIQNLQMAFASAVAAADVVTRMAQKAGSPVYVMGTSFGGKVINILLNAQARHNFALADRYMAIEGGRLDDTFTGPNYVAKIHPERRIVIQQQAFKTDGHAFPHQAEPLPEHVRDRVRAIINPYDKVALGQGRLSGEGNLEGIWAGADKIMYIGEHPGFRSHFLAPFRDTPAIRQALGEDLRAIRKR